MCIVVPEPASSTWYCFHCAVNAQKAMFLPFTSGIPSISKMPLSVIPVQHTVSSIRNINLSVAYPLSCLDAARTSTKSARACSSHTRCCLPTPYSAATCITYSLESQFYNGAWQAFLPNKSSGTIPWLDAICGHRLHYSTHRAAGKHPCIKTSGAVGY